MDEDGLVIEKPNQSDGPETGNGVRERSALELLCFKRGETNKYHLEDFSKTIRSCEVEKGLYNRGPRKPGEMAAHDDRRCLSAVSSILNLPFAEEINSYGNKHWWSYNNLNPGRWSISTCDYRLPGVVPSYRLNAGKNFLPLEDIALGASILASSWSKSPKQKIIWWMQVEALAGRGMFESVIDQWWTSLHVQYGSMGPVFAAYYENEDHPFVHLSPV